MIVTELTPQVIGEKLGKNLYNASGNLLLRKGVEINPHYYDHFKQQGYQSVYLLNTSTVEIESHAQLLPERFHSTRPAVLKRIFRNLLSDNKKKAVEGKDELIALAESILLNINFHNKNAHCILDLKTPQQYLYQHSINVAAYSVLLAERLNYSQPKKLSLVLASLLHDIGMLFIDSNIVNKNSQLEKAEFEVVKEHTIVGFRHLVGHCSFDGLSAVASVQHHERYDGAGYPKKIQGEAIHEYSRIITLLDFFDAWTSDRPHRRLHSIEKTIEQIKNDEGAFDPAIVEPFLDLFE